MGNSISGSISSRLKEDTKLECLKMAFEMINTDKCSYVDDDKKTYYYPQNVTGLTLVYRIITGLIST